MKEPPVKKSHETLSTQEQEALAKALRTRGHDAVAVELDHAVTSETLARAALGGRATRATVLAIRAWLSARSAA